MEVLQRFVAFCRKAQPQSREDIQRFFEGVIFFPHDNELLLQSFLFFNIKTHFPLCVDLLLFEKSPNGENTDQGKCDFVYLTRNSRITLIETKFIDTESTGRTERTRRNKHRSKVIDQVTVLKQKFSTKWNIPPALIDCCVFTTEDLIGRERAEEIQARYVPIETLNQWQNSERNRLETKVNPSESVTAPPAIVNPGIDNSEEPWMYFDECEHCFQVEICANIRICYFDLSDGD